MTKFEEDCMAELECYTNRIARGSITPMLYTLLKNTPDKDALLKVLGYERETEPEVISVVAKPNFEALFKTGREVK